MNAVLDLIGRILISAIFIYEGIDSIMFADKTKAQMAEFGVTWKPDFLLYSSIVFLLLGGLMLLIGYRIRLGAWLLLAYWIPATIITYSFWNDPADEWRLSAVMFMRNIAVAGGLLMIAAHGGGKYSIHRLYSVSRIPRDND